MTTQQHIDDLAAHTESMGDCYWVDCICCGRTGQTDDIDAVGAGEGLYIEGWRSMELDGIIGPHCPSCASDEKAHANTVHAALVALVDWSESSVTTAEQQAAVWQQAREALGRE